MQKYKVIATKEELQSIGIYYDLTGKILTKFSDYGNWVVFEYMKCQLDIPKRLLEKI